MMMPLDSTTANIEKDYSFNNLFHFLHGLDSIQNFSFRALFHFPRQHEFIQYTVHFIEIKDNIQFTYIGKVTIQEFDKQVHRFQIRQFIVGNVHGNGKEESCISSVNELVGIVFNKVCILFITSRHQLE